MSKNIVAHLPIASLILLLSACGGDESSSKLAETGNPSSPLADTGNGGEETAGQDETTTEKTILPVLPGYYSTSVVVNEDAEYTGATIIAPQGQFATLIPDSDGTFGTLQAAPDNQITGTAENIRYTTTWERHSGTLSGSASDNANAALSLEADETDYQSVATISRADSYSDNATNMDDLSGTYLMQATDRPRTEITISTEGNIAGSDESGCTFSGGVVIPDQSLSVIRVSFTAANCTDVETATAEQRNGDYSGLGILAGGDQLIVFGNNREIVAYFNGRK